MSAKLKAAYMSRVLAIPRFANLAFKMQSNMNKKLRFTSLIHFDLFSFSVLKKKKEMKQKL